MRIGIVCYPTIGGSGVVATEMAHALAHSGHEVHLLSYDRPSRMRHGVPRLHFHQVQVSAYPLFRYPPYDLALATRMLEVREQHGIDVFHVHYAIPHAVSAWLARSMSDVYIPFVTTLHGTDITVVGSDPAYTRPTRFAIEQSDAVTSVSKFLAEATYSQFGIRRQIHVIPNFVDIQRYRPGNAPRWPERPGSERLLVHASNFRPVKRTGDVVRAFAQIQRRIPARLLLVGDGPDREHALAVGADLGCVQNIQLLGAMESIESVLADADLFLSASETESFGLSMLEAMSCGVPCVSTRVGGVAEVLGDTGALTPFDDPDALAAAAMPFLLDPALYQMQSAMVRERAVREFASEKVVSRYVELYERLLCRSSC
jgi:L-malate glycosyltransferase